MPGSGLGPKSPARHLTRHETQIPGALAAGPRLDGQRLEVPDLVRSDAANRPVTRGDGIGNLAKLLVVGELVPC